MPFNTWKIKAHILVFINTFESFPWIGGQKFLVKTGQGGVHCWSSPKTTGNKQNHRYFNMYITIKANTNISTFMNGHEMMNIWMLFRYSNICCRDYIVSQAQSLMYFLAKLYLLKFFCVCFSECTAVCVITFSTCIMIYTYTKLALCSVCSIFSKNMWSVSVEDTWICIRDVGKITLQSDGHRHPTCQHLGSNPGHSHGEPVLYQLSWLDSHL